MISKIDQYVIDKVRERRIELGVSQAVLADYINVNRGFIGHVENIKRPQEYNITLLNEIAKALNCSIKDFFPQEPLG